MRPARSPARHRPHPDTAYLDERGRAPGPLWIGQRGPLTIPRIVQVVLAVGADAGIEGLRPHRMRDTYATRLRQGGADPAQVQALLGHVPSTPALATSEPAMRRMPPSSGRSSISRPRLQDRAAVSRTVARSAVNRSVPSDPERSVPSRFRPLLSRLTGSADLGGTRCVRRDEAETHGSPHRPNA